MSETARTWLKTCNKYWIIVKFRIIRGVHKDLATCVWLQEQCPFWLSVGSCDALLCYLAEKKGGESRSCLEKKHLRCNCANVTHPIVAMLSLVKILLKKDVTFDPSSNMQMNVWLTFNDTVLLQEGGRPRQGVWCCGTSWGGSGRTCGHDVVTGRRVLTPISIDLHVQKQFILFDTPGDNKSKADWIEKRIEALHANSLCRRLCKDWKKARCTTLTELAQVRYWHS